MLGASRDSMTAVGAAVGERLDGGDAAALAADLLSVAALLNEQRSLRITLADSGQDPRARAALVDALLADRISADALSVVRTAVDSRWSSDGDLVEAIQRAGAQAAFAAAEAGEAADRVEEELFRFGRIVAGDGNLSLMLSSPSVPTSDKQAVVAELIAEQSHPTTAMLVDHVVAHPLGRSVAQAVGELAELAAHRRGRLLAEVTVAQPLTDDQSARLATVLGRIYGRDIDLQIGVDPKVVGGVQVRVGEEIIDGTTSSRLEQARRRVAG